MKRAQHIRAQLRHLREKLMRSEDAGVLVEFGIVVSLFLFLFMSLLDFGRLSFSVVNAQKAAQMAARIAVVRPAACNYADKTPLPLIHQRGSDTSLRFGAACDAATGVCDDPGDLVCVGGVENLATDQGPIGTSNEIWGRISPLLPPGATINNLRITYEFDDELGFLGGPYTPMVTVELDLADFEFVSPLGTLANAAGATNSTLPNAGETLGYSSFSVSLPAEDLALGESG
ncbi:TadE/TadG family type IV pilus assembly protein [Ruegeria atlantica]|uniref:TadE/TadG family type IV pilus assembly protein n=1 Tax=Ruegeria atlantica TaxID=81569 RepID=UPI00147BDA35|nr:TadE/TadG family type IV pilus assembly protein [Ruegeria atlantica]